MFIAIISIVLLVVGVGSVFFNKTIPGLNQKSPTAGRVDTTCV